MGWIAVKNMVVKVQTDMREYRKKKERKLATKRGHSMSFFNIA